MTIPGRRPTGWTLPVREVRVAAGAGFVYPICGDMRRCRVSAPTPWRNRIDLADDGNVVGLS